MVGHRDHGVVLIRVYVWSMMIRRPWVLWLLLGLAVAACSTSGSLGDAPESTTIPASIELQGSCLTPDLGLTGDPAAFPGGAELVPCRERLRFLDDITARKIAGIAAYPARVRADAVFICEDLKWADPDMGYNSFGDCVQTQLDFGLRPGVLDGDRATLDTLLKEKSTIEDRLRDE